MSSACSRASRTAGSSCLNASDTAFVAGPGDLMASFADDSAGAHGGTCLCEA